MGFYPQKKPITLRDYLCTTYEPNWRFTEDKDYIVFNDQYYSGLSILIDKDAYYTTQDNETYYFDMLRINYRLPFMTDLAKARYGNFFTGEHGPSFFLTEPKNAEDIMIFDRFCSYKAKFNTLKYSVEHAIVISAKSTLRWKENDIEMPPFNLSSYAIETSQKEFEKALAHFYLD